MLRGDGNENGEKTTIGPISKKVTLHVQNTFFVHFLVVVLHDYNLTLSETSWLHVLRKKGRTCSFSLSLTSHFSFPLSLLASISHFLIAATKFHVVTPKKCFVCFFPLAIALFLVELRFASLVCRPTFSFFFSLSLSLSPLSLYSKFVDMTINLSLILYTTRIQKHFPLSVFVVFDSLVVSSSQEVGVQTLSCQNNLKFGIDLHD